METALFFFSSPEFERTRSVTTRGVEGMSRWRYVFLHRIHPRGILIGIFLLREEKRKENGEQR